MFTPGKLIFALPLKDTPPIVLAVVRVAALVAVVALPSKGPINDVAVTESVNLPVPLTSSVELGAVVPMPTLPFVPANNTFIVVP